MKEDQLDPKIEALLKGVKLKEPKPEEMTDYLSKVRSKIEVKQSQTQFHLVPVGIALVLALALSGLIYWMIPDRPQEKVQILIPKPTSTQNLTLEEEMAILEAFSEEYPTGTNDLLGEEGAAEDLILMDEIEFAVASTSQGASFNS